MTTNKKPAHGGNRERAAEMALCRAAISYPYFTTAAADRQAEAEHDR